MFVACLGLPVAFATQTGATHRQVWRLFNQRRGVGDGSWEFFSSHKFKGMQIMNYQAVGNPEDLEKEHAALIGIFLNTFT